MQENDIKHAQTELSDLVQKLKDIRATVNDWITVRESAATEADENDKESLKGYKEIHGELQRKLSNYRDNAEDSQKLNRELEDHVKSLRHQTEEYETKIATAADRLREKEEKLALLQSKRDQAASALGNIDHSTQEKHATYQQAVNMYQECLGLTLKRISGPMLHMEFTLIDAKDLDRLYVVDLKIEDNVYSVARCDPLLQEMDELVEILNKTNDFSAFLLNVRKCFKLCST